MKLPWRRLAAAGALVVILASRSVHADDGAEAQLHFQLGTTEFWAHRYTEALGHFLAAYRLAPTANTIFNVAQTYLALQRDAEAYRFLRDYVMHPGATTANRSLAIASIARIEPHLARVEIVSNPAGASIFIDRDDVGDVGVTPRTLALTPGSHELIVRMAGHREHRETITATVGETVQIEWALAEVVCTAQVTSTPSAASVLIDSIDRGVTPVTASLSPGVHRLVLRHEGYLDVSREFELRPDQTTALDERLPVDFARTGVLSVTSVPSNSTVRYRGRVLGTTPVSESALLPGSGVLEIARDGFTPLRRSIFIRVRHEAIVRTELGRPNAHRSVWIPIVGAVGLAGVVAGVSLGILALRAHDDFFTYNDPAALDRTNTFNFAADFTTSAALVFVAASIVGWIFTPDPTVSRARVNDEEAHAPEP